MKKPLLTAQEEIDLHHRIVQGDEEAHDRLVEANLGLVVYVIQKLPQWNLDSCLTRDDLVQEGNMALMRAAHHWKPKYRFASYARKLIKSQVMRAIENKGLLIHVPVPVQEDVRKIKRTETDLTQALGRQPTTKEIAERTGMSEHRVRDRLVVSQRQPISLDVFKKDQISDDNEYE
jgi:RNA polymerase primary sigma factor